MFVWYVEDSVYVRYSCLYGICFLLYGHYAMAYMYVLHGVWECYLCGMCVEHLSVVYPVYLCGYIGQVRDSALSRLITLALLGHLTHRMTHLKLPAQSLGLGRTQSMMCT